MRNKSAERNTIKAKFDEEFDIDFEMEFEEIETSESISRELMPKGFIILKYKLRAIFCDEYCNEVYELFYGDNAKGNRIISEEDATQLINVHQMTLVADDCNGKIWE